MADFFQAKVIKQRRAFQRVKLSCIREHKGVSRGSEREASFEVQQTIALAGFH